ncbi:MAG: NUDIX hydrolase, partial [Hyphomicrobium sp.]
YVVLGRQHAGHINAGLAYLPGGFIDGRDVAASGEIDIRASIARELAEETGLGPAEIMPDPGFLLTEVAAHVSFAVTYRSHFTADALAARIRAHIAADPDPELSDVVIVKGPDDIAHLAMPHYARVLVASPLVWPGA